MTESLRDVAEVPGAAVGYPFFFAADFATSRACSMNNRVTGLSVRSFRVTIPTDTGADGSSTGKTLHLGCPVENLNNDGGKIVRKRPLARSLIRPSAVSETTAVRGYASLLARKASVTSDPIPLSCGGSSQDSFTSSASAILRR